MEQPENTQEEHFGVAVFDSKVEEIASLAKYFELFGHKAVSTVMDLQERFLQGYYKRNDELKYIKKCINELHSEMGSILLLNKNKKQEELFYLRLSEAESQATLLYYEFYNLKSSKKK